MAAKADEEARRLDQRIAEIRRKNEAILKRRKEIEEDKKLAEEQNAVVQLKPSTEDWPRERTPAMKPSKREMGFGDANNSFQDSPSPRSSGRRERPGTASRGRDLMEKGAGPPPDPRSFLSDPDREWGENSPQSENSRGRPGRNRNESGREREFEEEFHERGGPQRDKFDQRERRGGRRSGGRGGGGDNERGSRRDEAWRVERHKIDEARIQRQRDSDGRWRREWDNEKLDFEVEGDDNKHPALTPSNTVPSKSLGGRLSQWKTSVNKETGNNSNTFKRQSDGANHVPGSAVSHISTPTSSPISLKNDGASVNSKPKVGPLASLERAILSESENFKITIKNKESDRKEERSGRYSRGGKMLNECQPKKRPGILRTSQSSVSDEDTSCPASPAKFTQYENMTFTIRNEPVNIKRSDLEKMSHEDFVKLSQMAKPPLPSFRAPIKKSTENFVQTAAAEEDDDSWEDVTTSGTESLYESGSESVSGTPSKAPTHTGVGNQSQTVPYTPEDFICLVPPEPQNPSTLVTSEHTPSMNVLCHLPPQIITVPMAQGILHHNPQAVIHQSPASVIIEHKPASAIIHQNPASAIIHQNPASAIIHQNPASAIIHQNPASAVIHQNQASAIIHQNPASAIIHQVPPPAIIHQKPPSEIIQQTTPSTIMHQNPPPSIIYQNPPPSIIHHNPQPEISHLPQKSFHKQSNMIQVIYSTPPPAFNHQTPPPPIVYQTPPPPITHHTPPPPITHRPPTAASTAVEEIISESIVFMPPNTQTATCKTIDAPPYPYETTTNLETTPNHSFDLDNYIVLVKPDTSFEEKVQLEHMNAQSGHLQTNIGSQTVLPKEVTNVAIVSNNEDVTKDEKLTDKPL